MAPILGRCKKVTEMGVMVKSEQRAQSSEKGSGKEETGAQSSMRNKECRNEKSLGWGKGRAL